MTAPTGSAWRQCAVNPRWATLTNDAGLFVQVPREKLDYWRDYLNSIAQQERTIAAKDAEWQARAAAAEQALRAAREVIGELESALRIIANKERPLAGWAYQDIALDALAWPSDARKALRSLTATQTDAVATQEAPAISKETPSTREGGSK